MRFYSSRRKLDVVVEAAGGGAVAKPRLLAISVR